MIPLTLALTAGFTLWALLNLRGAVIGFLALKALLPAYVAIPIGIGGAGVSATQGIIAALAFGLFCDALRHPALWSRLIGQVGIRIPALALGLFLAGKALSTLIAGQPAALFYLLDEGVTVAVLMLVGVRVFATPGAVMQALRAVSIIGVLVVATVPLEWAVQRPLLSLITTPSVTTAGGEVLEGFARLDRHRVQGFAEHPLLFAEYLMYLAVALCAVLPIGAGRGVLCVGVVVVLGLALYATGTRYVVLAVPVILAAVFALRAVVRAPLGLRPLIGLGVAVLIASVGGLAVWAILDVDWFVTQFRVLVGHDVSLVASVMARASQYQTIPLAILSNPTGGLLGEGFQSDLLHRIGARLDNYYLRTLIEGGVISLLGLVGAIMALLMGVTGALARARRLGDQAAARAFSALLTFFVAFAVSKMFLSMNFANVYFYCLTGAALALTAPIRRPRQLLA